MWPKPCAIVFLPGWAANAMLECVTSYSQGSALSSILKRSMSSTRLGDLLVQAGILTQMQLADAMRSAQGKHMQIGQVLVMNGLISPRDLQSALEAQSMLRDKSVEVTEALRCLKIAYKVGAPFKDILFEYASPKKTQSSKLGELLVESGVVTYEILAHAVEQSSATGLPLGRMLVLHQTISNDTLNLVLDLQVRLRDEMITREEAIKALREQAGLTAADAAPVEKPKAPPRKKGVRLGELMVMAGVLTETDVMNALEWGLVNQQTIGKVLISQMLVSQAILDAALELQKLVDKNELTATRASECLARVHSGGASLEEAVRDVREEQSAESELSYETLLTLANVLTEEELDDAFDTSTKSAAIIGKFLVLTGHLDVPTLQATLRCYQLVGKGLISQDDAVVTLDYCLHQSPDGPIKFDDALKQLGWTKESGLKLTGEVKQEEVESTADAPEKPRKHSQTIQPSDARATRLAPLLKGQGDGDDLMKGFDPSSDPPSALHRVFERLAHSYFRQGNFPQAQVIYERVLVHRLNQYGTQDPALVNDLVNLAGTLLAQEKYEQAEPFVKRAVVMCEKKDDALKLAELLSILSNLYYRLERYNEAEPLIRRCYEIRKKRLLSDHPDQAQTLSDYARLLRKMQRDDEAEEMYRQSLAIMARLENAALNQNPEAEGEAAES